MRTVFRRRAALGLSVAALSSLSLSCARVPESNTTTGRGKQLVITMQVRGQVNINRPPQGNYYFFVIHRTDDPTEAGPAPVVTGPQWGNGFAAPAQADSQGFVGFVVYDRDRALGSYGVFSAEIGGQLVDPTTGNFQPLGPPTRISAPQQSGSTLQFQLDLAQLPRPNARYVLLNIIATNVTPRGVFDAPKYWDALGDSTSSDFLRTWLVIDTSQNPTLFNSQQIGSAQERANDVRDRVLPGTVDDPDIDIVDWGVQVQDP